MSPSSDFSAKQKFCYLNGDALSLALSLLNRGRDISNLCRHEPVAMVNGAKFLFIALKTGLNRFLI